MGLRMSLVCSLALTLGIPAKSSELLKNGSFEDNGGAGTSSFAGWTVVNDTSGFEGSWYVQSGTHPRFGIKTVPPPPDGFYAAMTAAGGPGSHILLQPFTIPSGGIGTLSFAVYLSNNWDRYANPDSLDWRNRPNQQFRVDILASGSGAFDLGNAVLMNVYQTQPSDPLVSGYRTYSYELTSLLSPGETYILRLAEVESETNLFVGVDNVSIRFTSQSSVPEPSTMPLIGLVLVGLAGWTRRRQSM